MIVPYFYMFTALVFQYYLLSHVYNIGFLVLSTFTLLLHVYSIGFPELSTFKETASKGVPRLERLCHVSALGLKDESLFVSTFILLCWTENMTR